jgi:Na+-translocating ferredoxin:NAD+ oxidoreductase subunit B
MNSTILITIISLSLLALFSAIILYFIAQKFKIIEDPRIDDVQALLPAANCGGCGFAGCRNMAEALVNADTLEGLNCPVGGADVMSQVAKLLVKRLL